MTKWEYHIVEHFGGLFLDKIAALGQQGWEIIQVDDIKRPSSEPVTDLAHIAYERGYKLYLKRKDATHWTEAQRTAAEDFHDR